MWNTVLFDLDGTLTDSGEGITRSVQYALKKGFDIDVADPSELREFVGPPLKEMFMKYASLSEEEGERAVQIYRERYRVKGLYENRLYEGIPELLKALKSRGFVLAVASSKPTVFCRRILEYFGVDKYFTLILGSELDGSRVKKSAVIEETIRLLGAADRLDEVVMVGDRCFDVEGARALGISCVAVSFGYGSEEELISAGPYAIADSPETLLRILVQGRGQDGEGGPDGEAQPVIRPAVYPAEKRGTGRSGGVCLYDGGVIHRIWRIIYPFLIDIGVQVGIGVMLGVIMGFFGIDFDMGEVVGMTLAADLILIPVFWLMLRFDDEARRKNGALWRIPTPIELRVTDVPLISFFSICACRVAEVFVTVLIPYDRAYEEVANAMYAPGLPLQVLAIAVIGPVMEELLFRGVIFRRVRDYIGFWPAAVISGLLFGIAHGNLTQGVFACVIGILFAMLYEHYGSLFAPIAAHIANNLYAVLSTYISRDLAAFLFLVEAIGAVSLGFLVYARSRRVNVI